MIRIIPVILECMLIMATPELVTTETLLKQWTWLSDALEQTEKMLKVLGCPPPSRVVNGKDYPGTSQAHREAVEAFKGRTWTNAQLADWIEEQYPGKTVDRNAISAITSAGMGKRFKIAGDSAVKGRGKLYVEVTESNEGASNGSGHESPPYDHPPCDEDEI